MKALTEGTTPVWRAPPAAAASPWGRRPATLWALILESWRETIDLYARAGLRAPWGPFQ